MFTFELPEIGEGVVEGEIVRWLVAEGDQISADQPLCEVMTDKATVEISVPKGGRVVSLHGTPGDIIAVHAPLAELYDAAAAAAPVGPAEATAAAPPATTAAPPATTSAPPRTAASQPAPPQARAAPVTNGVSKTLATPAVRSYARDLEVDIHQVPGSGKGGRITRSDLDAFAAAPPARAPMAQTAVEQAAVEQAAVEQAAVEQAAVDQAAVAPAALPAPAAPLRGDERIRIIGLRRKIAEKMLESYRTVPHFTYVDEIDATALVALRAELKPLAAAQGVSLTFMPFIMKALCKVFMEFPTVNAVMDEAAHELVVRGEVNIGVATDTPAGLYVPVVRNVRSKSILELARETADLTERTRAGKVALSELQGGTFTITSVGNIGGRFATPIINHPEVAILGVNQIHDRPVVRHGEIVARKMMYLSPSFDHRVIDGAVAARFVAALKIVLEQPASLLLELR